MGVIFVAGCYGVGKSTVIRQLSRLMSVPFFSASSLISEANNETYGANKFVADKKKNQKILLSKIEEKLKEHSRFFLDGHFCIFKQGNVIDPLPLDDLKVMHFEKIVLLEAEPDFILKNLSNRDEKTYTLKAITALMEAERQQATALSKMMQIPLQIHQMKFDDTDVQKILSAL